MQYKVICGGILKRNGELALFDSVLDEGELDDPSMRVTEGYVTLVKGSDKVSPKAASASAPVDNSAAIDTAVQLALKEANDAKQAEIDAAVKEALAEKQAEIDAAVKEALAEKQAGIDAAQKAINDQTAGDAANANSAQDLLDKAKK